MTKGKIAGLTAAIAAATALGIGVAMNPSLFDRDDTASIPAPVVETAPAEPMKAPPPRPRRAPRATAEKATIAPDVVPRLPATEPELHARLKPVLNKGTRMELAAEGFKDAEQFASVAHAARNTKVPFALLKHRVLEQKMSLAAAIRASNPDIDAAHEATRARNAARSAPAAGPPEPRAPCAPPSWAGPPGA
jgi:hypothetical protein